MRLFVPSRLRIPSSPIKSVAARHYRGKYISADTRFYGRFLSIYIHLRKVNVLWRGAELSSQKTV